MKPAEETPLELFFFPKHNPPISVKARNIEEAEEKLKEIDNKK